MTRAEFVALWAITGTMLFLAFGVMAERSTIHSSFRIYDRLALITILGTIPAYLLLFARLFL